MTEDEIVDALLARAGVEGWPSPASVEAVAEAEETPGCPLPPLLRRVYLEVANGGFGPRGDFVGVRGGYEDSSWGNLLDMNRPRDSGEDGPGDRVPPGMIFVLDWGCTIGTLIDCRDPSGVVWGWEEGTLFCQQLTLAHWLTRYLDGAEDELMPHPPRESIKMQPLLRRDLRG